jgi:hypothetical protein
VQALQALADAGCALDDSDMSGRTPLFEAAEFGKLQCLRAFALCALATGTDSGHGRAAAGTGDAADGARRRRPDAVDVRGAVWSQRVCQRPAAPHSKQPAR